MRLDKKVLRYVNQNGYVFKNYNHMCKGLGEEPTSGDGKMSQFERWRLYFDFEKKEDKNEIIIKEIYDDKTIKENEKIYKEIFEEEKKIKEIIGTSKYRKNLLQVVLYLLISNSNLIVEGKASFAVKCGFYNQNILKHFGYESYIKFRETTKLNNPDKNYFKVAMNKHSFCELLKGIKDCPQDVIEGLLIKLKEKGWINYNEYKFGVNKHVKKILSDNETEKYMECEKEAIDRVAILYNLKQKKKKSRIELSDFIYDTKMANRYYKMLDDIVLEKLGYFKVFKYYGIWGTPLEKIKQRCTIKTEEEYKKATSAINKEFIDTLKGNSDKKIKKEKLKTIEFDRPESEEEQDHKYDKNEINYYNRLELLDLLVNTEAPIDAIDVETYISDEEAKRLLTEAQLIDDVKVKELEP